MKNIWNILLLMGLILGITVTASAQNKTESAIRRDTLLVNGNCGMCKQRIEQAVLQVKGTRLASWNSQTQQLVVLYDGRKATAQDIHKAVVAVGHDTDKMRANENTYQQLHGCCQYPRRQD
jgi:mercuric ion binding protein